MPTIDLTDHLLAMSDLPPVPPERPAVDVAALTRQRTAASDEAMRHASRFGNAGFYELTDIPRGTSPFDLQLHQPVTPRIVPAVSPQDGLFYTRKLPPEVDIDDSSAVHATLDGSPVFRGISSSQILNCLPAGSVKNVVIGTRFSARFAVQSGGFVLGERVVPDFPDNSYVACDFQKASRVTLMFPNKSQREKFWASFIKQSLPLGLFPHRNSNFSIILIGEPESFQWSFHQFCNQVASGRRPPITRLVSGLVFEKIAV